MYERMTCVCFYYNLFSSGNGCETRRGPACTPRRKFGSRPGCVARALGVQSREIWPCNRTIAVVEPTRPMQTTKMLLIFLLFFSSRCCCFSILGSHGTYNSRAFHAFPFVAATSGASSACGFASVCVCVQDPTAVNNQTQSQGQRCHFSFLLLLFVFAIDTY